MPERLYEYLLAGDSTGLASLFAGPPAIDTPRAGLVAGVDALAAFVKDEAEWLTRRYASAVCVRSLQDDHHVAAEFILNLDTPLERIAIPVAVVGQRHGEGLGHLRVYHSTWPLTGRHADRRPLVWPGRAVSEPSVIERYFRALADGDIDAILETFTPDGYLREPSGDAFRHSGPEGRRAFYAAAFAEPGGVPLVHATATQEGDVFAVEYVCDRWGAARFAPMGGCAFYELAPGGNRIAAVRIYDDVSPPS